MRDNDLDIKLDEWLDKASAEYGMADVRPGFERRILANVNSRLETRRRIFHWLPIAVSAATVLAFSAWVVVTRFMEPALTEIASHETTIANSVVQPSTSNQPMISKKAIEITGNKPLAAPAPPVRKSVGASIGKGLLFGPPSKQERLLLAYSGSGLFESTNDSQSEESIHPIEIPKTEIQTLDIPKIQIASAKIEPLEIKTEESEARP